jgi:hypothetical protein
LNVSGKLFLPYLDIDLQGGRYGQYPQNGEVEMTYTCEELSEARRALLSTLRKCEKVLESEKLPQSQRTLTERRVAALKLAVALIERELEL